MKKSASNNNTKKNKFKTISSKKSSSFFTRIHYSLFLSFFILGFVWGKFYYYGQTQPLDVLFNEHTLELLVEESKLPDDIIENFHLQHKVNIQVTTYKSNEELEKMLEEPKFDIVLLPSHIIKTLIQKEKLKKLNSEWIQNKNLISPDFSNLPYDKQSLYTVALFWGIDDDLEGKTLWTNNLAILNTSTRYQEAHGFINFMLQKDIAFELVKFKKIATTNRELDNSEIESKFKSSFIRQVSLKDLKY